MVRIDRCGCYRGVTSTRLIPSLGDWLPLVDSAAHTTILSATSKTVLKQTFANPSLSEAIKQCTYNFPLYDGVSVVGFTCTIGQKVIRGVVKEKAKATDLFNAAVAKGETAGLLVQNEEASDVFSTKLGNIPSGERIIVEVTYIGELKDDDTAGIRFTIPTSIAPRYGQDSGLYSGHPDSGTTHLSQSLPHGQISITVDINLPEGLSIRTVQSPSHPIAVSMGTLSTAHQSDPVINKASASLSLGSAALERDFVLIVHSKGTGIPKALLETHPTIPNHRALMATLIPRFSLPPSQPEIVFVADRSGSMTNNIIMLISAMKVFLKSMPTGTKFNICSFGSSNSFLWPKSKTYGGDTLLEATLHISTFQADCGGTETFSALEATIKNRLGDVPLEIILLTDGDIWNQQPLFAYINEEVRKSNGNIRVFPLGIGSGVSHSLIGGLARAGNGFSQAVQQGERLDTSVVRMLRGALSPHITNYTLEVKYGQDDDDFEVVNKVTESTKTIHSEGESGMKMLHEASGPAESGMKVLASDRELLQSKPEDQRSGGNAPATISLWDPNVEPESDILNTDPEMAVDLDLQAPKILQAPYKIPSLMPFSRSTVYLLMGPETIQRNPTSVILRATSAHGPLALEIPIEIIPERDQTIHQLAAKKASQDLEESRGWVFDSEISTLVKDHLAQKEAIRIGEKFQVANKWCSLVAVSANDENDAADTFRDPEKGVAVHSLSRRPPALAFSARELDVVSHSSDAYLDTASVPGAQNYAVYDGLDSFMSSAPPSAPEPGFGDLMGFGDPTTSSGRRRNASQTSNSGAMDSVVSSMYRTLTTEPRMVGTRERLNVAGGQPKKKQSEQHASWFASASTRQPSSSYSQLSSPSAYNGPRTITGSQSPHDVLSSIKTDSDKVLAIIELQGFDGSWSPEQENLSTLLGFEIPKVPEGVEEAVWTTIVVITFLETSMRDEEGMWELVVEKARGYVKAAVKDGLDELEKKAAEAIGKK